MNEYLWTLDGGRLQYQSCHKNSEVNWLFLPGGPGLGSEALADLTRLLRDKIPGVIWHFDLPGDGSNILANKPISNWRSALLQAVSAFEKVILVAHSTPAMYVQTMPELENILQGLVLIGSAPNSTWQKVFAEHCANNPDPLITTAEKEYTDNPTNETLRKLLIAAAKNCFVTEKTLQQGKDLFNKIPVNHLANEQAAKFFDAEKYQASWIPDRVKTLITTGDSDYITPLDLFQNKHGYQRDNILIKEISGAGHYPWFENPQAVVQLFQQYSTEI